MVGPIYILKKMCCEGAVPSPPPIHVLLLLAPQKSFLSVSASSTEHVIEETQRKNYTEDGTYMVKRDLSFQGKPQVFNSGPPEYVDRREPWFRFAATRVVVRVISTQHFLQL